MEESKSGNMRASISVREVICASRPSYFIQTKEGAYNGMIKHNLVRPTQTSLGSSLSFTDLLSHQVKLQNYTAQTGKSALSYFNLLNGSEEVQSLTGEAAQAKLSLFVPHPSQYRPGKHLQLQGFAQGHTDYLVQNRHKTTQADYVSLIRQLQTQINVTPIEHISASCGKKKVSRAVRNAVKAYQEIKEGANLDSCLLLPVLFENADQFMGQLEESARENLHGVMLFGGLRTVSLGSQFDSVRALRELKGSSFVIGLHENATPLVIAVMSLAGVDFFQTDYPLELALEGKAIRFYSEASQVASLTKAQLMEHCQIKGVVANDVLSVAIAAESLIAAQDRTILDIAANEASCRASSDPIQQGCACYTCANYSLSYLFHLQEVKEMNYNILLAIHNMTVIDKLFENLKKVGRATEATSVSEYVSGLLLKNFT